MEIGGNWRKKPSCECRIASNELEEKGRKTGGLFQAGAEGGDAGRVLFGVRVADLALVVRADLHQVDRYTPRPSFGDWFFPSPDGRRWDPDNFSADLRAANSAARLCWGCLDYRHILGSQLAQAGVGLYKISHLMGNPPEICRLQYAPMSSDALELDVRFPSPRPPYSRDHESPVRRELAQYPITRSEHRHLLLVQLVRWAFRHAVKMPIPPVTLVALRTGWKWWFEGVREIVERQFSQSGQIT